MVTNTAARRVLGLPLSTRAEALHFLAGTYTSRNLYIRHCAVFLRRVLCGHASRFQGKMRRELAAVYGVRRLGDTEVVMPVDFASGILWDPTGLPMRIVTRTRWTASERVLPLVLKGVTRPVSLYHTRAPEIRGSAAH